MKKILLTSILLLTISFVNAQYLVSYDIIQNIPGTGSNYDVNLYKITYNTIDVSGNPTIASGAFAAPVSTCSGFPFVVYQHGTVLSKENVPSRNNSEATITKLFAAKGYYAVSPDYLGLGDNPGLHPYIHAESEATAARDLIRAARELVIINNDNGIAGLDNGQVFISGYSQGGHAAMALHKHIQDNGLLSEFNIIASAPASGPYNISGAQSEVILSGDPYSNPGYLVYLFSSYELVYGNIYTDYSEILQAPYDDIVVPFFSGNNTTMSMGELNVQLPGEVDQLMQPDYLAAFSTDDMHPLNVALRDNDNYDWAPTAPVKLYYCTMDEQVNFQNALDAETSMTAAGATDVQAINNGPLNHGGCVAPSLFATLTWFESLKSACAVGIDEMSIDISISPNPVVDMLSIEVDEDIDQILIQSIEGKTLASFEKAKSNTKYELDMSGYVSGTYFITLVNHNTILATETVIKK